MNLGLKKIIASTNITAITRCVSYTVGITIRIIALHRCSQSSLVPGMQYQVHARRKVELPRTAGSLSATHLCSSDFHLPFQLVRIHTPAAC